MDRAKLVYLLITMLFMAGLLSIIVSYIYRSRIYTENKSYECTGGCFQNLSGVSSKDGGKTTTDDNNWQLWAIPSLIVASYILPFVLPPHNKTIKNVAKIILLIGTVWMNIQAWLYKNRIYSAGDQGICKPKCINYVKYGKVPQFNIECTPDWLACNTEDDSCIDCKHCKVGEGDSALPISEAIGFDTGHTCKLVRANILPSMLIASSITIGITGSVLGYMTYKELKGH